MQISREQLEDIAVELGYPTMVRGADYSDSGDDAYKPISAYEREAIDSFIDELLSRVEKDSITIEDNTATVALSVTLQVIPSEGQTPASAAAEITQLFTEYVSSKRNDHFMNDYGASKDDVDEWIAAGEGDRDEVANDRGMPNGGYEGPWVGDVEVVQSSTIAMLDSAKRHSIIEHDPKQDPFTTTAQDKNAARAGYASWEETFFRGAYVTADRSKDPSTQVGAVIVTAPDATANGQPIGNRLLSQGYNGTPNGWDDTAFPWKREGDDFDTKYDYVIHAEENALLNFFGDTRNLRGAHVYVTHFPCYSCVGKLVQAGITRIIYDHSHTMPGSNSVAKAERIAAACGIELVQREQPESLRQITRRS